MTTFTKALNLTSVGWLVYFVGLVVVLLTDHGEVGYVTVGAALAAAMLAWTRRAQSRAAFIVSLVMGVLLTLQSVAYAAADVSANPLDARVFSLDIVSLVAGLAIIIGSAWALRSRRAISALTA
jgi:hypothetical protein